MVFLEKMNKSEQI